MNAEVGKYAGLCASIAERMAKNRRSRTGVEYDDLYQEGLISVWQALARGVTPSAERIEFRMRDWARYLGRQNPVPYEALLPLDDFRHGAD